MQRMIFANGVYKEIMDGAILIKVKAVVILESTWHKLGTDILPFHWLSFFYRVFSKTSKIIITMMFFLVMQERFAYLYNCQ